MTTTHNADVAEAPFYAVDVIAGVVDAVGLARLGAVVVRQLHSCRQAPEERHALARLGGRQVGLRHALHVVAVLVKCVVGWSVSEQARNRGEWGSE
jgi:hypothetical protein